MVRRASQMIINQCPGLRVCLGRSQALSAFATRGCPRAEGHVPSAHSNRIHEQQVRMQTKGSNAATNGDIVCSESKISDITQNLSHDAAHLCKGKSGNAAQITMPVKLQWLKCMSGDAAQITMPIECNNAPQMQERQRRSNYNTPPMQERQRRSTYNALSNARAATPLK
jgi:hypothetical protein